MQYLKSLAAFVCVSIVPIASSSRQSISASAPRHVRANRSPFQSCLQTDSQGHPLRFLPASLTTGERYKPARAVEFVEFVETGRTSSGGRAHGPYPPVAPMTTRPLSNRRVITHMVFPVIGPVRWRNSFNDNRGSYRHTAIDIAAHKMQPVIAPFSGTLGFKTQTFWIYADNGYRCLGTHLNDDTPGRNDHIAKRDFMFAPNIRPGDHVIAGQLIGYVGDSGNATGPHLHFELFAPDGTLVNPCASLKIAYVMRYPRPAPVRITPPEPGLENHIEACFRKWVPATRTMTVLLTTREVNGRYMAAAVPKWRQFTLTPEMVDAAGGDEAIQSLPRDRPILYVESSHDKRVARGEASGRAERLVIPVSRRPVLADGAQAAPVLGDPEDEQMPDGGANPSEPDVVFEDFNRHTLDDWTLQGDCWADTPADEATYRGAIRGFEGDGFL